MVGLIDIDPILLTCCGINASEVPKAPRLLEAASRDAIDVIRDWSGFSMGVFSVSWSEEVWAISIYISASLGGYIYRICGSFKWLGINKQVVWTVDNNWTVDILCHFLSLFLVLPLLPPFPNFVCLHPVLWLATVLAVPAKEEKTTTAGMYLGGMPSTLTFCFTTGPRLTSSPEASSSHSLIAPSIFFLTSQCAKTFG